MEQSFLKMLIDYIISSINEVEKQVRASFEKEAEIFYYKKILEVAEQLYEFEKKERCEDTTLNELKKENEQLKKQVERNKYEKIKTAHEIISETIAEKVNSLVRDDLSKFTRTALKRQILETLKWELQVRYANDLKNEHIEKAKEFIQNYKIDDFYLKSSLKEEHK